MKKILFIILMAFSSASFAQTWTELARSGNASYLGGYYAAVSYACLNTNYTNDSGQWQSGEAISYKKGCAGAIWDAMFNDVEEPVL